MALEFNLGILVFSLANIGVLAITWAICRRLNRGNNRNWFRFHFLTLIIIGILALAIVGINLAITTATIWPMEQRRLLQDGRCHFSTNRAIVISPSRLWRPILSVHFLSCLL